MFIIHIVRLYLTYWELVCLRRKINWIKTFGGMCMSGKRWKKVGNLTLMDQKYTIVEKQSWELLQCLKLQDYS